MSKIYDEAKRLGMQVDHYYPLGNKLQVSGLHCEANLRIVPREENLRKGNSMPKNDPHAWLPLPQYQQMSLSFDVGAPRLLDVPVSGLHRDWSASLSTQSGKATLI